jgi:hypothetical protein
LTKPSKDDLTYVQFNFEWTKKMRREAKLATPLAGERTLTAFVRKAIDEKIERTERETGHKIRQSEKPE